MHYNLSDWNIIKKYNREEFRQWQNKEKIIFNWYYSNLLCSYCYRHFEIWWDPDKFYKRINVLKPVTSVIGIQNEQMKSAI